MAKRQFQTASERAFAEYLTLAGLAYQYEKRWGDANPDFTIKRPGPPSETIAIADIKGLRLSDEEEALLAAGRSVSTHRDPALRVRRRIHDVWRQFAACTGYPCVLVLAPAGDWPPDPIFVMAAMLGDYTVRVRVPHVPNGHISMTHGFGEHGKMISDQGERAHTRISAIGLMSVVCPDAVYSGYNDKVAAIAAKYQFGDDDDEAVREFFTACHDLEVGLTAEGCDFQAVATQIEYVVNPLAAQPFPRGDLAKGYVRVWEYDMAAHTLSLTYDWSKPGAPH